MADQHVLELLAGAEAGSQEASAELFEKYARHVLRAVRSHLNDQVRHMMDSDDLVQSV